MIYKKYKKLWNVIIFVLIISLIGTGVISSMATVTIAKSDEGSDSAVDYLVDNTEYLNENRLGRMKDVLSTVGKTETLEDYYILASTQIASEDYQAASESISKCLQLSDGSNSELYLDLLMKQGCIYVMLADYDKALKYLDMALSVRPNATDAYLIKAQIYSEKGDLTALEKALTDYLALRPNDSEIRELLAQTKFLQEDYQKASAQYTTILQNDNNPQILYLNGLTNIQLGDFDSAEQLLTDAIAQDDSFEGIYYYRGVCRMSNENYAGAVEDFTTSIDKQSMLQASYYTRGVCGLMIENYSYETGLGDLQKAAEGTDPDIVKEAQDLLIKLAEAANAEATAREAMQEIQVTKEGPETEQPDSSDEL